MVSSALLAVAAAAAATALGARAADAATEKLVTACSATLADADPPVLAPLAAVVGDATAAQLMAFLSESPLGELLLTSEGSTCVANMNGTALGTALVEGFSSGSCAGAMAVADIPFVQAAMGNLTAASSSSSGDGSGADGLSDFVRHLGSIPSDEIESFCALYEADVVPCLRSQVLPSLTTLRAKYASGCCDAWDDATVADYGYTVSGKLNKLAQLLGDVVCATQAAAADGSSTSQRCGSAFLASWVPTTIVNVTDSDDDGSDVMSASASASASASDSGSGSGNETRVDIITTPELLADALAAYLEIPTDQMCLAAEGEAYTDTSGTAVSTLPTAYAESGCVVALDRLATWVSKLPLASGSSSASGSGAAAMLETLFSDDGDCVDGSTFLAVAGTYLPSAVADAAATIMADACVHVATTYADGCSFSRAATLIDWDYEPARASQGGSESEAAAASDINSIETVPPDVTSSALSAATARSVAAALVAVAAVVAAV